MSFVFLQGRHKNNRHLHRFAPQRLPTGFGALTGVVRSRMEFLERRVVLSAGVALDPTFGLGGLVATDVPGKTVSLGESVAVTQPDGKIVVAGYSYNPAFNTDFLVARYNSDGSLDTSFGSQGIVTTDFYGGNDYARGIALTPDGKIVVAGYSREFTPTISGDAFAVARYNSDGSSDTTFGTGGKVVTDPSTTGSSYAYGMAIDGSGRVVVVGNEFSNSLDKYQLVLARYNSDGTPDGSFGTSGSVVTGLGFGAADGRAVAIDGNHMIVVAGDAGGQAAVARFNDDGTLDSSFGTGGVTQTSFGANGEQFMGLTIDSLGRPVAAGITSGSTTYEDFALARYTTAGALDGTFGSGGKVTTAISSASDVAETVTEDSDGRMIVAGSSGNLATAVRYTSTGGLDTAFGTGGIADVNFGGDDDLVFSAALDPLGYLVLGGRTDRDGSDSLALAKLTTDGILDATFGSTGEVVTNVVGSTSNDARGTLVQPDGKVVTVGSAGDGTGTDFAVTRYNAAGTPDTFFGQQGIATTRFFLAPARVATSQAEAVALDSQNRLLVAGVANHEIAIARYQPDGTPDTSFGNDGQMIVSLPGYQNNSAQAVAIDGNGKIVIAGWASASQQLPTPTGFAVLRLNNDGTFDMTFGGGNGWVVTNFAGGIDNAYGVVLQSDGKIVLAGTSHQPGNEGDDFALARYNSDGTLDTSFGTSGKVTTDFGDTADEGYGLTSDAVGRLIVAGASNYGTTGYNFAVARYKTDGSLDTTFGSGGKVVTDFDQANDFAGPVTVGPDGKIIVAGEAYEGNRGFDFALARYNTDGSLDTTFTPTGELTTDFAGQRDQIYGIAWQDPAHLVAVGSTYRPATSYDVGVARYFIQAAEVVGDNSLDQVDLTAQNDGTVNFQVTSGGSVVDAGTIGAGMSVPLLNLGADSTVTVNGTAGDDAFILSPGNLVVNGVTLDASAVNGKIASWQLNGLAGNDTFTVNDAVGDMSIDGGSDTNTIHFASGSSLTGTIAGSGNTLDYSAYSAAVAVNLSAGTATATGGVSGIATIKLGDGPSSVTGDGTTTLVGPNEASTWSLATDTAGTVVYVKKAVTTRITYAGIANLVGGDGNDTFQPAAGVLPAGSIEGGAGTDAHTFSKYASTMPLSVDLHGAVDMVTSAGTTRDFASIESIVGDASTGNALTGPAAASTWTLTAAGRGTVGGISFNKFRTLAGWSGGDTLVGPNLASTWAITAADGGSVAGTSFSGMANLVGGSGADRFQFKPSGSLTGTLDGGAASALNTLDYSYYLTTSTGTGVSIDLVNSTADGIAGGFSDIQAFKGSKASDTLSDNATVHTWTLTGSEAGNIDGAFTFSAFEHLIGSGGDTLIGANVQATWVLSGSDAGSYNTNTQFLGMANIVGGSGVDTFKLSNAATLTGSLDGGAGTNTINYAAFSTAVVVNLADGSATGIGDGADGMLNNIANATGGKGTNVLVGDDAANILIGGKGRNVIIGGGGANTLTAGPGQDLLIAGSMSFDMSDADLASIAAEWFRTDRSFADRVADLSATGSGGLNGSVDLISDLSGSGTPTVFDNAATDTLNGNKGAAATDWFFAGAGDVINNGISRDETTEI